MSPRQNSLFLAWLKILSIFEISVISKCKREKSWNLDNSWHSWNSTGCKRNIWKICKIHFDLKIFTFFLWLFLFDSTSCLWRKNIKNVKDDMLLNHNKIFLSFNLFFVVHPIANLNFRGFDPRVWEKRGNYGNFALNCTHFCKYKLSQGQNRTSFFMQNSNRYRFCKIKLLKMV